MSLLNTCYARLKPDQIVNRIKQSVQSNTDEVFVVSLATLASLDFVMKELALRDIPVGAISLSRRLLAAEAIIKFLSGETKVLLSLRALLIGSGISLDFSPENLPGKITYMSDSYMNPKDELQFVNRVRVRMRRELSISDILSIGEPKKLLKGFVDTTVTHLSAFEPHSNAYTVKEQNEVPAPLTRGWYVLYPGPEYDTSTEPLSYITLVNETTGQRIKIELKEIP